MKTITTLLIAALLASPGAFAQDKAHDHGAAPSQGEVRKVDKNAKRITIKHGPLQNLDMPAMTMVFQVKDPALLDKVKAGDKVTFTAENLGGALTVTRIAPAK